MARSPIGIVYAKGGYTQALLLAEDILETPKESSSVLEILAISQQQLGLNKEALASYERLYSTDQKVCFLYQIASLQYNLKRYGECVASLDQLIAEPKSETEQINISAGGIQNQAVMLKAATYNIKGVIAQEINQAEAAIQNFKMALKLQPDFALAKGNVAKIEKAQKAE